MESDGLVGKADGSRPRELLKAPGWLRRGRLHCQRIMSVPGVWVPQVPRIWGSGIRKPFQRFVLLSGPAPAPSFVDFLFF